MTFLHNWASDMKRRWTVCRDRQRPLEQRGFAALELIFFPLSLLTLLVLLPAQIVAVRYGWYAPPGWLNGTLAVLVSAAVGYITNYIAIEMLFKPYRENKWHFFSLISLGYWRQGLVPRNKHEIGEQLGEQVATKLLDPEKIASELCDMVSGMIHKPDVIDRLRDSIQSLLKENMDKITGALIPKIEDSVAAELDKHLSPQTVVTLWQQYLAPRLNDEENRTRVAAEIVDALKRRSPDLTRMLRDGLREYAAAYLSRKLKWVGGLGAETLADGLVASIEWPEIQLKIREKIGEEATQNMIRDEIGRLAGKVDEWLKTPAGQEKLAAWTAEFRERFRAWLKAYLEENLPRITRQLLSSDSLWDWIEKTLLPSVEPKLRAFIASQKDAIIAKLDIRNRVTDAIDRQDVREFHEMIDSVSAQHLGAIQVLGYFLGLLVGLGQLLR